MGIWVQWEWRWNDTGMGREQTPGSPLQEHPLVVLGSPTSPQPLSHGGSPDRAVG